jgi:hypothetical protein
VVELGQCTPPVAEWPKRREMSTYSVDAQEKELLRVINRCNIDTRAGHWEASGYRQTAALCQGRWVTQGVKICSIYHFASTTATRPLAQLSSKQSNTLPSCIERLGSLQTIKFIVCYPT